MPGAEYYHRQADLCVRMALTASDREERIRLLHVANEYRANAARIEALDVHSLQECQLLGSPAGV
jgi:hypothetical protein